MGNAADRKKKSPKRKWAKNKESIKNIKRIDSVSNHGWQVHVRRGGILKTKFFSDSMYGSKDKSLNAAKLHRDKLIFKMAKWKKKYPAARRKARSNTGHLGVSLTHNVSKDGRKLEVICATAHDSNGKAVGRKFSVNKYGYDQAVKKAIAWRKEMLRQRDK